LFFFGIAPSIQSNLNTSSYGARTLKEYEYFYFNILLIFIMLSYEIFYKLFFLKKLSDIKKIKTSKTYGNKISFRKSMILCLISVLSLIIVFYFKDFNIFNMLIRGEGEVKNSAEFSSASNLIVDQFVRPISIMCLMFYLLSLKKNRKVLYFLSACALFTCFPLAMPRFYAAAMYIPILLLIIPQFSKRNIFSITFIGSLLIIFPFLNQFRDFSKNAKLKLGFDMRMFTEGHFDSYQNFALIFFENITTNGRQLLGVIFFWVPRSIWTDKPVGSGTVLANELGFYFDNISANYFAEGYINFGLPGILLFLLIFSFVTAKLDVLFWKKLHFERGNYFQILYFVMLAMFFFVLRGDLLSSFAFTIGFVMSFFLIYLIVKE